MRSSSLAGLARAQTAFIRLSGAMQEARPFVSHVVRVKRHSCDPEQFLQDHKGRDAAVVMGDPRWHDSRFRIFSTRICTFFVLSPCSRS